MQTSECRTRETLKRYLAGWVEHDESSAIEAHVLNCNACEQTLSGLEGDPDTLVNFLRPDFGPESNDAVLQYAMQKAKEIGTQSEADHSVMKPQEAPPKIVGPYELIKSLGHGSMGAVYLGRHQKLGKQVAIKLLSSRPFRNDQFTARFQREIRAAGSLNHPSIINATDAGQSDSVHYLVMEHIDGLDLSRLMRLTGPLSIADTCSLMHSVALGLSHAHAAGIVHRDIKPSNLMLSRTGQVKILDFGLAQISLWDEASAELTTVGQLMGTIDYMAPEQAERADTVDYRADLYSLGATLFKLLCGRAPLAATPDLSPLSKLRLLATSQSPSLSTLRPDAPPALVLLVSKLLARDPAARPASAAHVAEMLAEFTTGSDLPRLMRTADEIAATHPKSSDELQPNDLPLASAKVASRKTNSGDWGSFIRWGVTAAALAFMAAGGVFITLETQKGQLVIESTDASAEVTISKAGKEYDSWQLVPGANTTRLYAGTYEVTIASGSDRFQLDRDKIEIKRGETVVARIHTTWMVAPSQTIPPPATAEVDQAEPVYDGKTLSMWLAEFSRERSPAAIEASLKAITSLANSANQDRISKSILAALPAIPEEHDFEAFAKLWEISGGGQKYVEHLLHSLDVKNEAWTRRALRAGTNAYYQKNRSLANHTDRDTAIELLPIITWTESELLSPEAAARVRTSGNSSEHESLVEMAGYQVIFTINEQGFDPSSEDKYLGLMQAHPALGASFWLALIPEDGSSANTKRWHPKLVSLIESKAAQYFIDPKTPEKYVAQAAMLLAELATNFDRTGMQPFNRPDDLVPALERRLRELVEHPERIPVMVQVDSGFSSYTLPQGGKSPFFAEYQSSFSISSNPAKCLLVCELFDLASATKAIDGCLGDIIAIHRVVFPKAIEGGVKLARNPFTEASKVRASHSGSLSISWPDLAVSFSQGTISISPQELLAIFICNHTRSLMPPTLVKQWQEAQKKEIQIQWIANKLRESDRDGDEFLDQDEASYQDFEAIDENHDMKISSDELLKYSIENGSLPSAKRR